MPEAIPDGWYRECAGRYVKGDRTLRVTNINRHRWELSARDGWAWRLVGAFPTLTSAVEGSRSSSS